MLQYIIDSRQLISGAKTKNIYILKLIYKPDESESREMSNKGISWGVKLAGA